MGGVGAGTSAPAGAGAQAAYHLPGGVGLHEPPPGRGFDRGQDAGEPLPGAGQLLVAGRQHAAGDQRLPEVIGGPAAGVGIQRLVGGGQRPGGDLGEDRGAAAPAQPVERGFGGAGRADRLEDRAQRGRDVPAGPGEQRRGSPPQAAALAPAAVIELVFGAAAGAGAGGGQAGAAGAGVSVRSGRGDRPPQLPAGGARCPAPQRGVVARVADRALGPADGRRAVLAAAGAAGGGPRRARRADRMAGAGEVAFPVLAAHTADGAGHPVAADADLRGVAAGPHGDRGGLAADPAPAASPVPAAARLADPLPGGVAGDDLLDHAAVRALSGDLTGGARLAHAPGQRAVKRYPGPAAAGARGRGQGRRPAGDQLGGQPSCGRRCPVPEHVRIGGQRRGQRAQRGRAGGHRIHRGGGLVRGQHGCGDHMLD